MEDNKETSEEKEGTERFIGREIYFKEESGKKHVGRVKSILFHQDDAIILEIKCNEKDHKVLYDNEGQIEESIGIAEKVLISRLEQVNRFFSDKRNQKPRVKRLTTKKIGKKEKK